MLKNDTYINDYKKETRKFTLNKLMCEFEYEMISKRET